MIDAKTAYRLSDDYNRRKLDESIANAIKLIESDIEPAIQTSCQLGLFSATFKSGLADSDTIRQIKKILAEHGYNVNSALAFSSADAGEFTVAWNSNVPPVYRTHQNAD